MLVFLFLAFVAAFAIFHVGKHRLNTPLLMNLPGAFCVWASIFSIGGAFPPSGGPWARDGEDAFVQEAYLSSLEFLAWAALFYGGAYLLQRMIAKRLEHNGND